MQQINNVKEIGHKVKAIRRMQGLTQEQLAATSGVGIRFIRDLEHGKETCQIGKVFHVLSMLGVEVFMTGMDSDSASTENLITKDEK